MSALLPSVLLLVLLSSEPILTMDVTTTARHPHGPLVRTPFGERPAECVLEVPHGSRVEEHPDGTAALLITTTDGAQYRHATPLTCLKEKASKPMTSSISDCPDRTCNSLPCNDWIDNAGNMNTTTFIGSMSAQYVTPEGPGRAGDQTLFYFIGAENTNGCPRSGNNLAILQPVLTYDPASYCHGSRYGWCMASWYCCPSSVTVHSTYIQNIQPGDVYLGKLTYSAAADEYVVTGQNINDPRYATTLNCPRQGRNFNWADVTLEVYAVSTCDYFAQGPMYFNSITLQDMNGVDIQPNWTLTSNKPCNGVIKVLNNGKDFLVQHSP